MQRVSLEDARSDLQNLVDAAIRGETVLIVGDHEQTVRLVPVASGKRPRKAGSAKGLITFADDCDA